MCRLAASKISFDCMYVHVHNPPPKDLHTYVVGEMADKAEYLFTGDECQVKAAHSDSG